MKQRSAGARRLPGWAPLAWFVVLAALLTYVVLVLAKPPGPLDNPDPAHQRDGLILDGPVLPDAVAGVRFGHAPVVLLFVRDVPDPQAIQDWVAAVPSRAKVLVVLPEPPTVELPLPTVVDDRARLADAVGMPTPVDGGAPVGYAVVDSQNTVRYATLDPSYVSNAFEVATIVGAVR